MAQKKSRGGSQIERNEKKSGSQIDIDFPSSPFFYFSISEHKKQIILNDLSLFMHFTRYEKEDSDQYTELNQNQ